MAEMAEKESTVIEESLKDFNLVAEKKNIPPKAGEALMSAMMVHIFLTTLNEITKPDHVFQKATTRIE